MAFLVKSALTLGLPPALVTFIGLLLAWRAAGEGHLSLSRWLTGFSIAVGYAVGHRIATGALPFLPSSVEHWLPLLALGAALLGIPESLPTIAYRRRWYYRFAFGIVAAIALLMPSASLPPGVKGAWVIVVGILTAVAWTGLNRLAENVADATLPFALALTAAATGVALFLSHTAAVSQLAGVLTATMGAAFAFVLWRRQWSLAGGAAGVTVALLLGVSINGVVYADLPVISALLLWLAPLAGWLRLGYRSQPPIAQVALQLVPTLLTVAVGLVITVHQVGLPSGGY